MIWVGKAASQQLYKAHQRRDCPSLLLFSWSGLSDSLQPRGLQHTRLPCPSLSPGVCSNSCALRQWCHPTISPSVSRSSSRPQFFPDHSLFQWVGSSPQVAKQSIGASRSVLLMNIQGWFLLGLTVWSPCSPRDSQESPSAPQFKSIDSSAFSCLPVKKT